jgi:hypothetical protein
MELVKSIPELNCKNCIYAQPIDEKEIYCCRSVEISHISQLVGKDSHCGEGMWLIEIERDDRLYRVPTARAEAVFSIMNEGIDPFSV